MDILHHAIKRTIEEVAGRGGIVMISAEAKRLAAAYPGYGMSAREIADALTVEGMRSKVALQLGGTPIGDPDERASSNLAPGR